MRVEDVSRCLERKPRCFSLLVEQTVARKTVLEFQTRWIREIAASQVESDLLSGSTSLFYTEVHSILFNRKHAFLHTVKMKGKIAIWHATSMLKP